MGSIKQELHDTLGENGLPYWKALNGYLLGQIGKLEMEGMVKSWLKGKGTIASPLRNDSSAYIERASGYSFDVGQEETC